MNKDHINEVIELIKRAYLVELTDGVLTINSGCSVLTFGLEKYFEISDLDAFRLCSIPPNIERKVYSLDTTIRYLELYRDTGEINLKKVIENENKQSDL